MPAVEMHPQRWGDPARRTSLPPAATGLVELAFGKLDELPPAPAPTVPVPPSALSSDQLLALGRIVGAEHVHVEDRIRRLRTRGKSTPDLLRARAGDVADAPDAVVRPASHDEVLELIDFCQQHRIALVPFGGGTSVTGGLVAARDGFAGVLSLDLIRMTALVDLDPVSMTATLQPGLRGPEAEALLAEHGLTIGHFPQSFEFASIGGFAATRSSGQASAGYGRFDALVVRLKVATPRGTVVTGSAPATAAGPDLRQLFLGSEGAFGVITEITVRVRRVPAARHYEGWRWASFEAGAEAMRSLVQAGLQPTVLRLSDETETAINLAEPDRIGAALEDQTTGGCLMIVGFEGDPAALQARRDAVSAVLAERGGTALGTQPGDAWARGRFDAPYLRDALLDLGVLVETLETATFWSQRPELYRAVREALIGQLGPQTLVLCHISHVYETGCSLYFTVAAKASARPVEQWLAAKAAATEAILAVGATVTHHHAVGTDHRDGFAREIGPIAVDVLRAIKTELDPHGILNPGVLIP